MSKHTPGPWSADVGYVIHYGVDVWSPIHARKRGRIAMAKREADARLIASAPDLLEALLMVRDADDDAIMDFMIPMPPLARAKIDAAIAKATGND